jgi:hypothetical protein
MINSRPGGLPPRHTAEVNTQIRSRGPLVVAVFAALLHLVVGFFYLAGGLVMPGYALLPLWVIWFLFAWWLVTLARRNSWWTPLVPLAALVLFFGVLTLGEVLLGWQA